MFTRLTVAKADCENGTINSQADASALAQCSNFPGAIILTSTATGNFSFNGLETALGGFDCAHESQVTGVSSNSLYNISGYGGLTFIDLASLSYLDFPNLTTVGAIVSLANLPSLKTFILAPEARGIPAPTFDPTLFIQGTALETITSLFAGVADYISIAGNPDLNTVEILSSETTSLAGAGLQISQNSYKMNVSLPNLQSVADRLEIDDCTQLYIPSLWSVNGSFLMTNAGFSSLSAPKLTNLGNLNFTGDFSK